MIAMISTAAMAVRRKPVLSLWMMLLLAMVTVGAVSIVFVLVEGLKVTNLTNALPWGLWITVDLSAIGLGAGAFTLSAAVYIFGLKKYEAIARAAVFLASDDAEFITGVEFPVDGGRTI